MEEFNPIILAANVVKVFKFHTGMTVKYTLSSQKNPFGSFYWLF